MPKVEVETVHVGPSRMNCYLAVEPESGQLLVVDPGADAQRIIQAIGERKPAAVLLTHGHYDHIGAVDELCCHYGIPLYMHGQDVDKLTDPDANVSWLTGQELRVKTAPIPLTDGQKLTLGGIQVQVLHTPGHSKGSCCYLIEGDQCVFCGDTLFDGGYGRYDFADGSFTDLKASLGKLYKLNPKRIAYPGHGGSTFAGRDWEEQR